MIDKYPNINCRTLNLWKRLLCLSLVCVPLWHSPCVAAEGDNEKKLAEARSLIRVRKYDAASAQLEEILREQAASIGDPAVEKSREMYAKLTAMMAADMTKRGRSLDAIQLLKKGGSVPGMGTHGQLLAAKASELQEDILTELLERGESLKIVQFVELFPDDQLLNEDELLVHKVKLLESVPPDLAYKRLSRLKSEGVSEEHIRKAGISEGRLVLMYTKALMGREWFLEAASLLRDQLQFGALSDEERLLAEKMEEQCLVYYAAACIKLRNLRMCQEALDRYAAGDRSAMDSEKSQKMKKAAQAVGSFGEPVQLTFPGKYVVGKGTWKDTGRGFYIDGVVQTGNCANSRGGKWETAEIIVAAGTVIDGGVLRASHGKLKFEGTREQPVILRNVRLECDYTAAVSAAHTVFINCSFQKTGSWHWKGGFSSKWTFTNCMLANSNFVHLTRGDYGIRWNGCTFVRCKFPPRMLNGDAKRDATGEYRGHWNLIKQCSFVECVVTPSLVWGTEESAFIQCKVDKRSDFASAKPLKVELFASPPTFFDDVSASTGKKGSGLVEYVAANIRPDVLGSGYWRFIPELASDPH